MMLVSTATPEDSKLLLTIQLGSALNANRAISSQLKANANNVPHFAILVPQILEVALIVQA